MSRVVHKFELEKTMYQRSLFTMFCVTFVSFQTIVVRAERSWHESYGGSWMHGYYMQEALDACYDHASAFTDAECFGFTEGVSLSGSLLQVGEHSVQRRAFSPGCTYRIIVAGDQDVSALSLCVHQLDGTCVGQAESVDAIASLEFQVDSPSDLWIDVELQDSTDWAHVAWIILQSDGIPVSRTEWNEATFGMLDFCGRAADELTVEVLPNDGSGQWCLIGGVLRPGSSVQIPDVPCSAESMSVVVGGSPDVDEFVVQLVDRFGSIIPEMNGRRNVHQRNYFFNLRQGESYDVQIVRSGGGDDAKFWAGALLQFQ